MNFMNLAKEYSNEKSKFAILTIPYEGNVTYGTGASKGPDEIIKASEHMEYYEEQFDKEPFIEGIQTITLPKIETEKELLKKVEQNFPKDKFTVSLGGDHSVTIPIIKTLGKEEDFDIIIFDAHPDFFDSWNNSQYNHRCVAKRSIEKHNILEVGIRSMDVDEFELIKEDDRIDIIKSYDLTIENFKEKLSKLKNKVYISIDVDAFDPSFLKNTGTPEPGGLQWKELIDMLKVIFEEKNVIGADIVEFAPETNFKAEAYSLARLCYKLIALKN
ncbi:agmatinase [Candidatus Woesearchaeota archaeon]|nr:agmatinase [Candidatus Woesearchaeota archaeon]